MGFHPVTAYTTNFQLPYLEVGQPARDTRTILEDLVRKTDAALTRGPASPPASQDLTAVAGRVATLETLAAAPAAGGTPVTYLAGTTGYNDAVAGWTGLRVWQRNGVVTVSGAFTLGAAAANYATIAQLPTGILAPPASVQSAVFQVRSDRTIRVVGAQASGYTASGSISYAAR